MIAPIRIILKHKTIENRLILGAIFTISFLLRLYRLGWHDFWYDEIGTVIYAQHPWFNLNAPLYWILLHYWIKIFGLSEFSLRFPSLVFSFLSVILVFILGKNFFNKQVGILASLLIGLSSFHLWYAQEARDYTLALFLGLLSCWLLYNALKEDKNILWLLFICVSITGLYTNYFYIFLFISQGFYLIFLKKLRLNFKGIVCFLIAAMGFSFYLPRFLSKFYVVWGGFWIPKPGWKSFVITAENFILGYNGSPFLYLVSDILMGVFFIYALAMAYKKSELRANFIFCFFLFFIPIITAFFFSRIFFSVYLDRGLLIFSPYFYLILSVGIFFLNKTIRRILFVILITTLVISDCRYFKDLMVAPFAHRVGVCIKKSIRPLVRFLDKHVKPEDAIAYTNECIMPSLDFYSRKKLSDFYFFFDPKFPDSNWQRPIQEGGYYLPFYKINNLPFKRLWVISSDWERSGQLDENSQSVKDWCNKNLKLEFAQKFVGVWVFRYVKNNL